MDDEHKKLKHSLDQLQSQLDEMRRMDPAVAESLAATIGEAKSVLSARQSEPNAHQSIIERLRNEVLKYEASHPSMAANLGSLLDALSNMGI